MKARVEKKFEKFSFKWNCTISVNTQFDNTKHCRTCGYKSQISFFDSKHVKCEIRLVLAGGKNCEVCKSFCNTCENKNCINSIEDRKKIKEIKLKSERTVL